MVISLLLKQILLVNEVLDKSKYLFARPPNTPQTWHCASPGRVDQGRFRLHFSRGTVHANNSTVRPNSRDGCASISTMRLHRIRRIRLCLRPFANHAVPTTSGLLVSARHPPLFPSPLNRWCVPSTQRVNGRRDAVTAERNHN
jgi:hypothetical protein